MLSRKLVAFLKLTQNRILIDTFNLERSCWGFGVLGFWGVGVINVDAPGVHGPTRDFSISGSAKLGLLDIMIEEAAKMERSYSPDPNPAAGSFFRSDHFAFAQVGVPAVSFRSGSDLVEGGTERAAEIAAAYSAEDYHQQSDEWSPDWDLSGIVRDAQLIHAVAERLGNSKEWPNWAEGSEFKSLRDASAEARD